MRDLSRSQLLVYGAVAVAILLVGARWIRAGGEGPPEAPAAGAGGAGGAGASFSLEEGGGDVVVHVAGAVRSPGVYRLPEGSRVDDAIERAGGPSGAANPEGINLAALLSDGQQVVVPPRVEGAAGAAGSAGATGDMGPISLGSATVEQLDTIEGIGPVTAAQIIAYRDEHGGIASVEELDEISGIGPVTMEALRARLQP